MNAYPSLTPKKPSLKKWFKKHNVSSNLMSGEQAIYRAIVHEQLKHELTLID